MHLKTDKPIRYAMSRLRSILLCSVLPALLWAGDGDGNDNFMAKAAEQAVELRAHNAAMLAAGRPEDCLYVWTFAPGQRLERDATGRPRFVGGSIGEEAIERANRRLLALNARARERGEEETVVLAFEGFELALQSGVVEELGDESRPLLEQLREGLDAATGLDSIAQAQRLLETKGGPLLVQLVGRYFSEQPRYVLMCHGIKVVSRKAKGQASVFSAKGFTEDELLCMGRTFQPEPPAASDPSEAAEQDMDNLSAAIVQCDMEAKKGNPYFVQVSGWPSPYRQGDKMYFVRQRGTVQIVLGADSLKMDSPVWKLGKDIIGTGDTLQMPLTETMTETIKVTDGANGDKKFDFVLEVYEKPIVSFAHASSNFDGYFLFDDASQTVLQNAGDYQDITDSIFHKDYAINKKKSYFVGLMGDHRLDAAVPAKLRAIVGGRKQNDPGFAVTLLPTSPNVRVDKAASAVITSDTDIEITFTDILPQDEKHYLNAFDQSGELVGRLELVCRPMPNPASTNNPNLAKIKFIYIVEHNKHGRISKIHPLSTNSILDFLNNKSHNQLFIRWNMTMVADTVDIDSMAQAYFNSHFNHNQSLNDIRKDLETRAVLVLQSYNILRGINESNDKTMHCRFFLSPYTPTGTDANGLPSETRGSNDFEHSYTMAYSGLTLKVAAHEQGHDLFLPHTFCHEKGPKVGCPELVISKNRGIPENNAKKNYMDYMKDLFTETRVMFFKYQVEGRISKYYDAAQPTNRGY
jgi:hypothetical protein